jgi:hypothetical protein
MLLQSTLFRALCVHPQIARICSSRATPSGNLLDRIPADWISVRIVASYSSHSSDHVRVAFRLRRLTYEHFCKENIETSSPETYLKPLSWILSLRSPENLLEISRRLDVSKMLSYNCESAVQIRKLPPDSAGFQLSLFSHFEDGGDAFLWNVDLSPNCSVL